MSNLNCSAPMEGKNAAIKSEKTLGQRDQNCRIIYNIKLLSSTPYYAQANGQVESSNKILIIKLS